MKLTRIVAAGAAVAALVLPGIATASAASTEEHCDVAVIDDTAGSFDESAVSAAVQDLLQYDPDLEVYVRGVAPLAGDMTPSVYDQQFRDACNPATDYVLIALDGRGYAGVFYGSYFDRLVPVLGTRTGQFLREFYASHDPDKTAAVVNLLHNFRVTLVQNPDFADYVKYPVSYSPIGPTSSSTPTSMWDTHATLTLAIPVISLIMMAVAIVALIRDKRDHSQR